MRRRFRDLTQSEIELQLPAKRANWHSICRELRVPSRTTKAYTRVRHAFETVVQFLFRCSHKRITLPITPPKSPGESPARPYVVCLDCGGKFVYDWEEMKMGEQIGDTVAEGPNWLTQLLRRYARKTEHRRSA